MTAFLFRINKLLERVLLLLTIVAIWLTAAMVYDLLDRQAGVDVIAVLAIVGAILLGEYLAATVIGVMLATGDWLERLAEGRAHRELTALISRAPQIVHRHDPPAAAQQLAGVAAVPAAEIDRHARLRARRGTHCRVLRGEALDGDPRGLPRRLVDRDDLIGEPVVAGVPVGVRHRAPSADRSWIQIVLVSVYWSCACTLLSCPPKPDSL